MQKELPNPDPGLNGSGDEELMEGMPRPMFCDWVHPEMDFEKGRRETSKERAARSREPLRTFIVEFSRTQSTRLVLTCAPCSFDTFKCRQPPTSEASTFDFTGVATHALSGALALIGVPLEEPFFMRVDGVFND